MAIDLTTYNSDNEVKYINSSYKGAPELKDVYGSLNALLKTVLTTGFNNAEAESISLNTTTRLATIKVPLNHGYINNQVVNISGATQDIFNGDFRVLKSTPEYLTVKVDIETSITEATTASVLALKVAPLGFTVAYENESKSICCFKNSSTKSPGILKVIDEIPPNDYNPGWAKYARVVMGSEIDNQGEFINNEKIPYWHDHPNVEKVGNGISGEGGIHGFAKWDYAIYSNGYNTSDHYGGRGTYPTDWRIIGDSNTFYLMIKSMGRNNYSYNLLGFGNYNSENPEETTNICMQAKDGVVPTNYTGEYNYSRTRNDFGVLDGQFGGYILSNIYGGIKNSTEYGRYRCQGLFMSSDQLNRPWRSSTIKGINPITGEWLVSPIFIRDRDHYTRGKHRGIQIFYGTDRIPDGSLTRTGDLVLYVQTPMSHSEYETMPLLFSLQNWSKV